MTRPTFLCITGPTAAGKTALSLGVARALDGEIVSMDSRQVYRGMDIGTAKATPEERGRARHHNLDVLDPDEPYSAGRFARDARRWIREIRDRDRLPMLVGGTGFFLKALTEPLFREPPLDPERVEGLRDRLEGYSRETLERWVRRLDPERARVAAEGGPQRMIRTLEVALLTGRPLSRWHREAAAGEEEGLRGVIVVLELDRDVLDRRIRERAERMVEEGLLDEVRTLLEAGYRPEDPGMTGAGYREIVDHLSGETGLDEAVDRIEVRTRQYARRQLTWFRHQLPEDAVRIDAGAPLERQVSAVVAAWREASGTAGRTAGDGREDGLSPMGFSGRDRDR